MPFIIGWLLGGALNAMGVFRALFVAALLFGVGMIAHHLLADHGSSETAARIAGFAAPIALGVWAIWNPASSKIRMWIVDGFYVIVRIGMWLFALGAIIKLLTAGFHLDHWVKTGLAPAIFAAILWGVQHVLHIKMSRSHRLMEERRVET